MGLWMGSRWAARHPLDRADALSLGYGALGSSLETIDLFNSAACGWKYSMQGTYNIR